MGTTNKVSRKKNKCGQTKRQQAQQKKKQRESSKNSSRIHRHRASGSLHSKRIPYDKDKRTIHGILKRCVKTINEGYVQDDTKAPLGNNAKPAFLSKPSVNIYFGCNTKKGTKSNSVFRTAYAVGSGTSSIGLDPETMRIYPAFPDLLKLLKEATRLVKSHSAEWREIMKDIEFNFGNIKIYYSYYQNGVLVKKTTEMHMDVE